MTEIWLLYSTFPNKEKALSVAHELMEARLIACANIYDGVLSVYRWEGSVHQEPEVALMAKTAEKNLAKAIEMIKHLHPYQVPCITAYPVAQGFQPFLQWVAEETSA